MFWKGTYRCTLAICAKLDKSLGKIADFTSETDPKVYSSSKRVASQVGIFIMVLKEFGCHVGGGAFALVRDIEGDVLSRGENVCHAKVAQDKPIVAVDKKV